MRPRLIAVDDETERWLLRWTTTTLQ